MELKITEDNELIKKAYSGLNYKVEYSQSCTNNRCIIFFSGNGLYYPDTEEEFTSIIIEKDRYEWTNIGHTEQILSAFKMIIYVRDVYKSWYEIGISEEINSIDKLIELLKGLTDGYDVVTCGNSAGGYIANVVGHELHANRIFDFGGQWVVNTRFKEKYINSSDISKYYDSTGYIGDRLMYFYSALCDIDLGQYTYVADSNIVTFPVKSQYHGYMMRRECYKHFLSMSDEQIDNLIQKYSGKMLSIRKWIRILLKGKDKRKVLFDDLVDSHKSLQILMSVIKIKRHN